MSSVVKRILTIVLLANLFSSCGGNKVHKKQLTQQERFTQDVKNYNDEQKMIYENQYGSFDGDANKDNVHAVSNSEVKDSESIETINKIQNNPINVVDDVLSSPTKRLNIAIVVPLSGKYASLGNTVVESAMFTINQSKYNNTGTIKVYDIGQLAAREWKENKEVKRLIRDNNDVIIGSFFADTTEKLLSVLPEDKLFISFINDAELSKEYANLLTVGMDDSFRINSLFKYLQDHKRQFISVVLPSTKKGYVVEKLLRKLAPYYEVIIVNSQFYQASSRSSILAALRGLSRSSTATYIVGKNGKLKTETYRANKAKKSGESAWQKTRTVKINAVYIDADESDLTTILNGLNGYGMLNKDILFFSNAVFDPANAGVNFGNVYYIGYNYDLINKFNDKFSSYFSHKPNYTSYITYDTISMLYYISNEGKMLPRNFYNEDGFRGVLDDFRFTREGNIERRFGVYKLRNQNIFRIFIPNDYFQIDATKDGSKTYFK